MSREWGWMRPRNEFNILASASSPGYTPEDFPMIIIEYNCNSIRIFNLLNGFPTQSDYFHQPDLRLRNVVWYSYFSYRGSWQNPKRVWNVIVPVWYVDCSHFLTNVTRFHFVFFFTNIFIATTMTSILPDVLTAWI